MKQSSDACRRRVLNFLALPVDLPLVPLQCTFIAEHFSTFAGESPTVMRRQMPTQTGSILELLVAQVALVNRDDGIRRVSHIHVMAQLILLVEALWTHLAKIRFFLESKVVISFCWMTQITGAPKTHISVNQHVSLEDLLLNKTSSTFSANEGSFSYK